MGYRRNHVNNGPVTSRGAYEVEVYIKESIRQITGNELCIPWCITTLCEDRGILSVFNSSEQDLYITSGKRRTTPTWGWKSITCHAYKYRRDTSHSWKRYTNEWIKRRTKKGARSVSELFSSLANVYINLGSTDTVEVWHEALIDWRTVQLKFTRKNRRGAGTCHYERIQFTVFRSRTVGSKV